MSHSTTLLDLLSADQAQKEVTANAALDAASPAMLFGRRASTATALTWGYYGGAFKASGGTLSLLANGTVSLPASSTRYIEADPADGTVAAVATAFTTGKIPLYKVVTGSATVTSYEDWRLPGLAVK